jgi:hypothetical protein
MGRTFDAVLAIAVLLLPVCWPIADAQARKKPTATSVTVRSNSNVPMLVESQNSDYDSLQKAVDLMHFRPKVAEQKLVRFKGSLAKAFLAFLYMSGKVPTANYQQKVDGLMNSAIAGLPGNMDLGDIKKAEHYHYTSMPMLMRHLRFIGDAEGWPISIPIWMIANYPKAANDAFGTYWGSTRDLYLGIEELSPEDKIEGLPAISKLLETLGKIYGDPGGHCFGTIRNSYSHQQYMSRLAASIMPLVALQEQREQEAEAKKAAREKTLENQSSEESPSIRDGFATTLQRWANLELWNYQTYQDLARQKSAAEKTLAQHYTLRFHFNQNMAMLCAKAAISRLCASYTCLGGYDPTDNLVPPIFSKPALSFQEMERRLASKSLSEAQLAEALRLATLNGANMAVINWLIEQGTPVNGTQKPPQFPPDGAVTANLESPLFTAVLRPEVVSALLKAGANPDETNPIGKTA